MGRRQKVVFRPTKGRRRKERKEKKRMNISILFYLTNANNNENVQNKNPSLRHKDKRQREFSVWKRKLYEKRRKGLRGAPTFSLPLSLLPSSSLPLPFPPSHPLALYISLRIALQKGLPYFFSLLYFNFILSWNDWNDLRTISELWTTPSSMLTWSFMLTQGSLKWKWFSGVLRQWRTAQFQLHGKTNVF